MVWCVAAGDDKKNVNSEIILNTNVLISMLWLIIQKWKKAGIFHVWACGTYGREEKHNIFNQKI
jgi:hypothetical protein